MVSEARINKIKDYFGIYQPEQWQDITPEHVLQIHDVGPKTLDEVRLYLAMRELTLKDDQTPEFWKQHFDRMKIGAIMGSEDIAVTCPFTVLIDSQEKQPFSFQQMFSDSDRESLPLVVPIKWKSLGAAMGDYSVHGYEGHVHVERKSMRDAQGTILGWGERRDRFQRELENLAQMDYAAVVVECSFGALLTNARATPKRSKEENKKTLYRQVLAWQQDFRVPWVFCDTRRLAEITTFRILERFWRKEQEAMKQQPKFAD